MFKTKLFLALLLLVIMSLVGGVVFMLNSNDGDKKETITLTIWEGEKSILHLPLYVALQEGYFKEQGINVKLVARSGNTGNNPYTGPITDLILTDPVECLYRKSVNPDSPLIIAAIASRDGTFLMGREKEIFSWEKLRGKNIIAYPPETGPGLALDQKLRAENMAPMHDLSLYIRIPRDLRLSAFKSGSGSYIQLAGPEAVKAEQNGTGYISACLGEETGVFPSVLCAAWPEIIDRHPGAVQGFVNAIYKAQLWMREEPELGTKAVKNHFHDLDKKISNQLLEKYSKINMWQPCPWIDNATFNKIEQTMEVAGQLVVPVTYDSAVNNSFARRAAQTIKYIPKEEREKSWLRRIFD